VLLRFLLFWCCFFWVSTNDAFASSEIIGMRAHDKPTHSRFVLELSQPTKYKLFTLNSPPRVVIDLIGTSWPKSFTENSQTKRITRIRHANHKNKTLRIVLDMAGTADIKKHFALKKTTSSPYRVVLDIKSTPIASKPKKKKEKKKKRPVRQRDATTTISPVPRPVTVSKLADIRRPARRAPIPQFKARKLRIVKPTIIIDPGHGGRDPGAIGRRRTKEKHITLNYAKALKDALQKTRRYKVYTTRQKDYFVSLQRRVDIARNLKGNLFISIHADAHRNRRVKGASVYTLSEKASDKEAAELAKKENRASFVGKVSPNSGSDVDMLLIDLVQRDTKNMSSHFAETLARTFKGRTLMLRNPHRFAGFRVLTAPEIPSVLVEIGYLSNRQEEKIIRSSKHKKKLVKLFVQAIDTHFRKYPVKQ
jgi:N-acetylmuramoyl-L-alanine amidase